MPAIPALLARGGSSRGLIIRASDLADYSYEGRESLFAAMVGSPDVGGRQVNGVGGGTATTSKIAVVSSSSEVDVDVEYEFYQMIVDTGHADVRGTCGNMSAAVGQFAIESGMVTAVSPTTAVRIRDANTGQLIVVDVEVDRGQVVYAGDHEVAGVPGSGSPVRVRFMMPAGRSTGTLFPTGAWDELVQTSRGEVRVSVIDAVNPVAFVHADSLPILSTWHLGDLDGSRDLRLLLDEVRRWAAVVCGFAPTLELAEHLAPMYPFVGLYWDVTFDVTNRPPENSDVAVRMLSGGSVHRAVPLSAGLASATLARLRVLRATGCVDDIEADVAIAHPSGILLSRVHASVLAEDATVTSASVLLTARRIMSGVMEL